MVEEVAAQAGTVTVSGAEIYHEVRGAGPPIVFISGATGDAGHYTKVADLLADAFTVVTYDRRANSRSPRPEGWAVTSMDEQADDLAALIEALGLIPATVFGTSGGAIILLNLIVRHPETLRGAIIHEPPLYSVSSNPQEVMAGMQALTEEGMQRGGPRGAMEMFVGLSAGDETFEALNPQLRERMLSNAEVFFGTEAEAFRSYVPTPEELSAVEVPVIVAAGAQTRDPAHHLHFGYEASQWVARHLGTEVVELPGAHAPYFTHPAALTEALRHLVRDLSEQA